MRHVLPSQFQPYLPQDIWNLILKHTGDPLTCLVFCRYDLARQVVEGGITGHQICSPGAREQQWNWPSRTDNSELVGPAGGWIKNTNRNLPGARDLPSNLPGARDLEGKLYAMCIQKGYLGGVQLLYKNLGCFNQHCLRWGVQSNQKHVLAWLIDKQKFRKWSHDNMMDDAAAQGDLELVQWLHDKEVRKEGCTSGAMGRAAENGHLEVVKWLHNNRAEGCSYGTIDRVARNGHLRIVRWLREHRKEGYTTDAMDWAAKNGHLNILKYLHSDCLPCKPGRPDGNFGCTAKAMNGAAEKGHMRVLLWLHIHRKEGCTRAARELALKNGHQQIVRWLDQNYE